MVLAIATKCLAVSALPEDPQRLFAEARLLQEKGDLQGAENHYLQYLQMEPRSAEGHANLGIVLAHENKLQAAVGEYETALRLNPGLYGVNLDLGIAYYRETDYSKALAPLQMFLSAEPTNLQARELLGLRYTQLDRYEEAIENLAPLQPKGDRGVLYALAACYVRVRKMDEAQRVIQNLLMNEPDSPRVRFLMGETYVGLQQFPQALIEFQGVYSADSRWPEINLLLGGVEVRLGKYAQAEEHLRAELHANPSSFADELCRGSTARQRVEV